MRAVYRLHCNRIDIDPTFGRGMLHKGRPLPKFCSDLAPRKPFVRKADCRKLKLASGSGEAILFDPPFLAGGGKSGRMHSIYGSFPTVIKLYEFYSEAMAEFRRILRPGGILVFKCQDINNGRTQGFSHCEIYNIAQTLGFYALDLFILINENRMPPHKLKHQSHARKTHCYFWVFKKSNQTNYLTPL